MPRGKATNPESDKRRLTSAENGKKGGRPELPPELKRKGRNIRMTDAEYARVKAFLVQIRAED